MVLSMNNFTFNGDHYIQVGGTAMGTKVAPGFANCFMGDFEEQFVYPYRLQPLKYLRFKHPPLDTRFDQLMGL